MWNWLSSSTASTTGTTITDANANSIPTNPLHQSKQHLFTFAQKLLSRIKPAPNPALNKIHVDVVLELAMQMEEKQVDSTTVVEKVYTMIVHIGPSAPYRTRDFDRTDARCVSMTFHIQQGDVYYQLQDELVSNFHARGHRRQMRYMDIARSIARGWSRSVWKDVELMLDQVKVCEFPAYSLPCE